MFTTSKNKRAIVSVINDLVTDQRVHRTCMLLQECGYEVVLVGRVKKDSLSLTDRSYTIKRFRLFFEKGPLFYLTYNVRLLLFLLFHKSDLLVANDLDTLFPNFIAARLKDVKLIYDSHEVFCEVPELQKNKLKKGIWLFLESKIVPRLKYCITVNDSIAAWFQQKYNVVFTVVKNIPHNLKLERVKSREELGLPIDKHIVILQGAGINVDRGAEELVEAMEYIDSTLLLIIGGGDVISLLKKQVEDRQLKEKIKFIHKLPALELKQYTVNADLGITIDKNTNINYQYSLPNKVFDYIHAGIPILASRLVEIEKLIKHYNIGDFIDNHDPKHIAQKIQDMLSSSNYNVWKNNVYKAAQANNWEVEKEILKSVIVR